MKVLAIILLAVLSFEAKGQNRDQNQLIAQLLNRTQNGTQWNPNAFNTSQWLSLASNRNQGSNLNGTQWNPSSFNRSEWLAQSLNRTQKQAGDRNRWQLQSLDRFSERSRNRTNGRFQALNRTRFGGSRIQKRSIEASAESDDSKSSEQNLSASEEDVVTTDATWRSEEDTTVTIEDDNDHPVTTNDPNLEENSSNIATYSSQDYEENFPEEETNTPYDEVTTSHQNSGENSSEEETNDDDVTTRSPQSEENSSEEDSRSQNLDRDQWIAQLLNFHGNERFSRRNRSQNGDNSRWNRNDWLSQTLNRSQQQAFDRNQWQLESLDRFHERSKNRTNDRFQILNDRFANLRIQKRWIAPTNSTWNQTTRNGDVIIGQIGYLDRLLFNGTYHKDNRWWSGREKIIEYPYDVYGKNSWKRQENITAIRIYNRFNRGLESSAKILSGGVGYRYVKIKLSAPWNKGFDYLVQLFGR